MKNYQYRAMKTKVICIIWFLLLSFVASHAETGKIRIASCQFPVSADINSNYRYIEAQLIEAKLKKADVVHFPECALSGYPGSDFQTLDNFNWDELHRLTDSVLLLADKLNIWVILGSLHKLSDNNKPHNSLYVITPEGKVADRYDKRFCTSTDLKYSSPGDHFATFTIVTDPRSANRKIVY